MISVKKFYVTYKHEKSVRIEMVDANSYEEAWLKILANKSPEETMRIAMLAMMQKIEVKERERVYA